MATRPYGALFLGLVRSCVGVWHSFRYVSGSWFWHEET